MNNNFSLLGKTILVTGATSGIGFEICKQIILANGNFIGIGRNTENLEDYIKVNALIESKTIKFDLENIENINSMISQIDIKIDGIVHSAGIAYVSPMHFFDVKDYDIIRKINLDSILVILSQLLKKKSLKKNSSIVFISSISSIRGAKGNGLYAITKSALDSICKVYANELYSKLIRVNTIQPGMVETDMAKKTENMLSKEIIQIDRDKYPFGYGSVEDVALPVIFLLSNASKWITGQSLVVDGGRTSIL